MTIDERTDVIDICGNSGRCGHTQKDTVETVNGVVHRKRSRRKGMSAHINASQTARTWSTQKIIIKTSVKHFPRREGKKRRVTKRSRMLKADLLIIVHMRHVNQNNRTRRKKNGKTYVSRTATIWPKKKKKKHGNPPNDNL